MKKSLFLYLFLLAALMNIFTYSYFSRQHASDKKDFAAASKVQNDSILVLYNNLEDANYFSLERNQNAQDYLSDYTTSQLIPVLTNKIMDMNDNPAGNALIPYEKIGDAKFIINKVKVLNHRWIIADFSDGKYWGEVLLKYFVEGKDTITFERIESQLYQPQKVE